MEKKEYYYEYEERNIIEVIHDLISKARTLRTSQNYLDDLTKLDILLKDFDNLCNKYFSLYSVPSRKIVKNYFDTATMFFYIVFNARETPSRQFLNTFDRFLSYAMQVLPKSQELSENSDIFFQNNFSKNFPSLWNSEIDSPPTNDIFLLSEEERENYFSKIEKFENGLAFDLGLISDSAGFKKTKFYVFGDNFKVTELDWNDKKGTFEEQGSYYELSMNLEIGVDDNDAQKLTSILYMIITSLSNIDGVKIEFEDIKSGSLLAKIKIHINNLLSKEQTIDVLRTGAEIAAKAASAGQVSHSEIKKTSAEIMKIKAEQQLLEKELESKPTDFESKIGIALDLEKRALENEGLKIKNIKAKLEVVQTLSELAAKGYLDADKLKIEINDVTYLLKEKGELKLTGINIKEIT